MNSSIDPYETLSKCGVHLKAHIIYLLKKLGYNSLIAISKIDPLNIKSIEMIIIKVFGNELRRNAMTENEKLLHFGEIFSKFPDSFQILPGEEVSIQSAVEISNRILKTNEVPLLQINNPNSSAIAIIPSPSAIESKINEALKDEVKDMNALGVYTLDKNWFVFDKSLAISLSAIELVKPIRMVYGKVCANERIPE